MSACVLTLGSQEHPGGRVHDHPDRPVDQARRRSRATPEIRASGLEVGTPAGHIGGHRLVIGVDQRGIQPVRVVRLLRIKGVVGATSTSRATRESPCRAR